MRIPGRCDTCSTAATAWRSIWAPAHGTTVSELLATVERVSGRRFPVEYVKRREGDSPALVADNAKAKSVLGWAPSYDLASIVETAWNWHSRANFGTAFRDAS